jgi:outer membrane protein
MQHKRGSKLLAFAMASPLVWASPSSAETLLEALTKAYQANPTISGARANQRSVDEDVDIARANGRPSLDATGTYAEQVVRTPQQFSSLVGVQEVQTTPARSAAVQGQLNVPLYSGGTVRNAVNAANLRVDAGQNSLRGTEATIFSRVVGAYMDVIRDSQIVLLNEQNVRALDVNLHASSDRFEAGDLTRTDVAQSQSRLAVATSDLERVRAQLIASKENYIALVGTPPVVLEQPPELPSLPETSELAVSVALNDNPDIEAAHKERMAAGYDTKAAQGAVAPRLSAFAQGGYTDYLSSQNPIYVPPFNKTVVAGAQVTLPLYQGGRPGAQSRKAAALESAAIERSIEVERGIISQTRAAYASWQAALLAIASNQKAVSATELALEGVKAENSVGSRTILDILNAEQEALNARVQLVTAKRDAYVAAFTLIAAMGHASARDLRLDPAILYDPNVNFKRVQRKLLDFDFGPKPAQISTTTGGTPSQDAKPIVVPGY